MLWSYVDVQLVEEELRVVPQRNSAGFTTVIDEVSDSELSEVWGWEICVKNCLRLGMFSGRLIVVWLTSMLDEVFSRCELYLDRRLLWRRERQSWLLWRQWTLATLVLELKKKPSLASFTTVFHQSVLRWRLRLPSKGMPSCCRTYSAAYAFASSTLRHNFWGWYSVGRAGMFTLYKNSCMSDGGAWVLCRVYTGLPQLFFRQTSSNNYKNRTN